jgi:hypothetical protein
VDPKLDPELLARSGVAEGGGAAAHDQIDPGRQWTVVPCSQAPAPAVEPQQGLDCFFLFFLGTRSLFIFCLGIRSLFFFFPRSFV